MDPIQILCEGQDRLTRRRIQAAYWQGAADAMKSPPMPPKTGTGQVLAFLRRQAE